MRQSTLTFGVLLFIFVVYITVRGQLPAYLALFKRKIGSTSSSSNNGLGGGGSFGGGGATGDFSSTSDASSNLSATDFNTLLTDI